MKGREKMPKAASDDAFEMHFFENMIVCGKRGGTGFINATRVDVDGNCPNSFEPCSTFTSLENTFVMRVLLSNYIQDSISHPVNQHYQILFR